MQESSNSLYDVMPQMPHNNYVTLSVILDHYDKITKDKIRQDKIS